MVIKSSSLYKLNEVNIVERNRKEERTGFQEISPYNSHIDLQTDFVMVYGIDSTMQSRIEEWKKRGYVVHLMTGISWGEYHDYLNGRIDGLAHWDESQEDSDGEKITHGNNENLEPIPYMVPSISFSEYLTAKIKKAVDAGVEAIHLEEPESWVVGGYSEAFKREWQIYYKEPWKAPHESVDGQYKASKLKAYLYTRCLDRICAALKEYAKVTYNRDLRFYVPTHSLINYTQWRIVSPESRLMDLPSVDGYIAQIWTGTSRTPNVYEGIRKERTFETSFLEYGIMQELVRGTGRRMWFLQDPIEDNPNYSWKDYKENYLKILTSSLLQPHVAHYEICPWPNRVFNGKYLSEGGVVKERIPKDYATMLLNLMHTLNNMDQNDVVWEGENTQIGVLLADSCMFQRNYPEWHKSGKSFRYDGTSMEASNGIEISEMLDWSSFYGLALPLLKDGIPVRPVQLDNIRRFAGYLDDYRVLVLSYEFMKPEFPDLHNAIAGWVKDGGILIYVGDGSDAFHQIKEWWNTGKSKYTTPTEHLFESLGLSAKIEPNIYKIGKGVLGYLRLHPSKCAKDKNCADKLRKTVKAAMIASGDETLKYELSDSFVLRRGPYIIGSVMNECKVKDEKTFEGTFVDLYKANLPIVTKLTVKPGEQCLLFDLNKVNKPLYLIAASSRIVLTKSNAKGFDFEAIGPEGVQAVARFFCENLPLRASAVNVKSGEEVTVKLTKDVISSTVLFEYLNCPDGIRVKVTLQ